jgi:hypothetical protein
VLEGHGSKQICGKAEPSDGGGGQVRRRQDTKAEAGSNPALDEGEV